MRSKKTVSTLYREIGKAIHKLRTRRKPRMSQQAIADEVGVSRASVANMERGHHRIQIHVLYDLAAVLEVEPHDLLPHTSTSQIDGLIPADMKKELSSKERVAVGRLLRKREEGDANE